MNSDLCNYSLVSDNKTENEKIFVVHRVNDDLNCSEALSESKLSNNNGELENFSKELLENDFLQIITPTKQQKECKELQKFMFGGHHRKISSIAPIITQTDKYKDEYDLSQEEMIENFISWKKHFELNSDDMQGNFKAADSFR